MKIHLALPNSGTMHSGTLVGTHWCTNQKYQVELDPRSSGCLAHNFNMCFCHALNKRKTGTTHFAMLHSDIVPDAYWLDFLEEERERHGADIMSAVIPLKDGRGSTSCGVGNLDSWHVTKLSLHQLHEDGFPKTFDLSQVGGPSQYLAANVGAFVWKFDGREELFAKRGGFRVMTTVRQYDDGNWRASFYPDDWDFSRWAHLAGLKVMCTTKHRFIHQGMADFPNDFAWGTDALDTTEPVHIPFEPYPSEERIVLHGLSNRERNRQPQPQLQPERERDQRVPNYGQCESQLYIHK